MVTNADVKVDSYQISLAKLTGQDIKDVQGYITRESGDYTFKVTCIVLEDGSEIGVEGEHDFPYLTPYPKYPIANMDDETLRGLYRQSRIEDGESVDDDD